MATIMEDVDSESGSQNGLQGVDIDDPAHEKERTMVTVERPGIPGEAHSSGCSYHKQTVSISVTVKSVSVLLLKYASLLPMQLLKTLKLYSTR